MRISSLASFAASVALAVGVGGLIAPSASAQDTGPSPAYGPSPPESVEVIAPRIRVDSHQLNGPLERVSMSTAVPYDDLDLTTRHGARELRRRVYFEARNVCGRLAETFPFYEANGDTCFRTALDNALVQADGAINDARLSRPYGNSYGY